MNHLGTETNIAIAGMGVISPFGLGLEPFSQALEKGESGIKPVARFPVKDWCSGQLAGAVPEFSLEELVHNPKESAQALRTFQLAWAAMHLALQDAALTLEEPLRERTGIFVGLSRFVEEPLEFLMERLIVGRMQEILPVRIEKFHPHGTAAHLSYLYKIFGPTLTFPASGHSGIQALETAILYLENDLIDAALVLSVDPLSPFRFHAEAAAGMVSKAKSPDGAPRPYDREADGLVPGEGAVAFVLERERDALAQGAKIHARLAALETAVMPEPFPPFPNTTEGTSRVLARLFARIEPKEVGLIHGDGRGLPRLDQAESLGIRKVLDQFQATIPVTSIHGSIGYAGGTSVFFQIVSTARTLQSSTIPAIQNFSRPRDGCDLDYVSGRARSAPVEQAVVLSQGWGGHQAALLMRKGGQ